MKTCNDIVTAMECWAMILPHVRARKWRPLTWRTMLVGGLAQIIADRIGATLPRPATFDSPNKRVYWSRLCGIWAADFQSQIVETAPGFVGNQGSLSISPARNIGPQTVLAVLKAADRTCGRACRAEGGLCGLCSPWDRYTVPQSVRAEVHRALVGDGRQIARTWRRDTARAAG